MVMATWGKETNTTRWLLMQRHSWATGLQVRWIVVYLSLDRLRVAVLPGVPVSRHSG